MLKFQAFLRFVADVSHRVSSSTKSRKWLHETRKSELVCWSKSMVQKHEVAEE